ncbi:MAG: glycosyltransferase family 4 protein [Acidobacteria bacterium]|nr:glycosyltransferase family 4 protein [Acidobacteriota bacterium]MCA1610053.1 glycosyltransferase family 4 protein [Acidobacteriota bacterium]
MRILNLVAGQKWTGTAAVVFDQTAALVEAGVEAQFGFVGESPLAERLLPLGWARPLMRPLRGPLDYVSEIHRLSETLRREPFEVVHAHGTHDHHVAAWALRGSRARLVRTIHNLRHARRDPATRWLFRKTRTFAFANSEIARRFGEPEGAIHSPVIDAARFSPAASREQARIRVGIAARGILVGTVGKMAEGRGHRASLAAAAPLGSVTLVHVGHGELLTVLKDLAASLGSGRRNVWMGYQEEILPDLYRSWDAFLFPASGSEQGQRAILEAMASGLPVVAVDVPGVRDLLTDGREGFVVPESGIAPALARLAADPALRLEMGVRARERSLAFTPERYAAKAAGFYESLLLKDSVRGAPSSSEL